MMPPYTPLDNSALYHSSSATSHQRSGIELNLTLPQERVVPQTRLVRARTSTKHGRDGIRHAHNGKQASKECTWTRNMFSQNAKLMDQSLGGAVVAGVALTLTNN
ncbi:unnamed protein product [Ectocarpus sp. 13 AM-2016]